MGYCVIHKEYGGGGCPKCFPKTKGMFRKKPVVIEAHLFTGHNSTEIEAWMIGQDKRNQFGVKNGGRIVLIYTLEGVMEARPGDWIIRGVRGELYPCKPDIFEATYDPA